MTRAPMKAVRDKMVCRRASQEARMVNRVIGGISRVLTRPRLAPQARTCNNSLFFLGRRPNPATRLIQLLLHGTFPGRATIL